MSEIKYDRILVCGSRTWRGWDIIAQKLEKYSHDDTVIITGKAPGADSLAEWWAVCTQHDYMGFPARWKVLGKSAGPIRNMRQLNVGMLGNDLGLAKGRSGRYRDWHLLVLAFHDDYENSKGTKHMAEIAQAADVPVKLVTKGNLTDKMIDERTKRK